MANLKTFSGFPIQNLTSDPVPFAQAKTNDPYAGVWSSGGAMNTARVFDATAQTGGNSAGQIAGGTYPGGSANTEQYNGTAWTEVNNLNTARFDIFGTGTQTSAIAASGYTTDWVTNTETWNGSSWTEVSEVNTGRKEGGSSGISATSALIFGGEGTPSSTQYALTELWNGSSWTEVNDLNAAIYGTSGGGTQTDAIRAGGVTDGAANPSATVETWNGTSWTETTDINTARGYNAASAANSTAALIAGGTTNSGPSLSALTESWNGSSWTEVNDLATARYKVNGSGTSTEALAIGGGPNTSGGTATEEWAFTGIPPTAPAEGYSDALVGQMYYNSTAGQFKAIKTGVGSWSSGTSMPSASAGRGMAGPTSAAIAYGGTGPPGTASQTLTEYYNGSSWTEVADLNQGRFMGDPATQGSQTAALFAAGAYNGNNQDNVESWNGSAWSEVNNVPTAAHSYAAGAGTQTAALAIGAGPPNRALVASWDGSNWTDVGELNTGRYFNSASGTQTAGLCFAGDVDNTFTANTEAYDGTSWTELNNLNTARATGGGAGTQTSALMITGNIPSPTSTMKAETEQWDGTSWTEVGDVATARNRPGSTGATASNAMIAGGQPPYMANVEEWEIPDFAINTVTTS